MCNPMLIVTVATTLYSGYTQKQQANEQAKVARNTAAYNSQVQKNEGQNIKNAGIEEENKQRRMTAELLSQQRAQLGAGGVVVDSGSALQLQEDTTQLGETDALRIRSNYNDQGNAAIQGAALTTYEGEAKSAQLKAVGKAAFTGSILSAGGSVASSWYSPKSAVAQQSSTSLKPGNFNSNAYQRSLRVGA